MKTLKKLMTIMLALGLTVGAVACGDVKGTGNDSQTSETVVGQELSQADFAAAVQALYNAPNLQIVLQKETDGVASKDKMLFADGKVYMESVDQSSSRVEYGYVGQVDGKYYQWASNDNAVWDYVEITGLTSDPTSVQFYLESIFTYCTFTYYEFNNKTQMMEFADLNSPTVSVKVVKGQIVEYHYEDMYGNTQEATLIYNGAVIGQLPALD